MEKAIPHYKLHAVKALASAGRIRSTVSALAGAAGLGLDFRALVDTVLSLESSVFYKSMTTHADHRVWHDVYRPWTTGGWAYMKLTVPDDVLVVSFKEL